MSLMLINPKHRPSKRRKPRSAAQKAATRRMLAARRGHSVASPRKRRSARRSNPIGLHRVHHTRRRTHRRHNPIGGGAGQLGGMLMNGLKGAAGAVAVNAVTNFLPAAVKTGNVLYVTRTALALLIGAAGKSVLGQHARPIAEGALAVNFADLINSFGGGMLPGAQLHGVSAYVSGIDAGQSALPHNPAFAGVGAFVDEHEYATY